MDDRELLQEYRERQSEKAFAELVARHVCFVYATALRLTGERQAAEDVVQAVFLLLARKSWMVRDGNALPGWLYRATQRTAFNEMRKEQRRRQRETEAMNNAELDAGTQAMLAKLLPLLDEALRQLNPVEQNLIILRFFENKSLRETGATAGFSEQATHNRITRAVEKLRQYFARSGVTVASGAVETALTTPSSQAVPIGLAAKVTSAALAGSGAALGIGDAVLKFFFSMNTKTQVALAVVVVALIGLPFLRSANVPDNTPAVVGNSSVAQPTAPPTTPQATTAQTPPVVQAPQPAAPEPVAASNPTTPPVDQSAQPQQILGPTQPRATLPTGNLVNAPTPSTQDLLEASRYASDHPLSHNMGVRVTGTLGPGKPVDVTMTGIMGQNRILLFEPQNGGGAGDYSAMATFTSHVAPRDGGYQVNFSASFRSQQPGSRPNGVQILAQLQPGESANGISVDGLMNLTATLIEVPAPHVPVNAQAGNEQNLLARIWGGVRPDAPIDISLAVDLPGLDYRTHSAMEKHQIGTGFMNNGGAQPVVGITQLILQYSPPNVNAAPGSYLVQYHLQFPRPGTTINAAGNTVPLYNGPDTLTGFVLLQIGETMTVQDIAGVGKIQISLSAADY